MLQVGSRADRNLTDLDIPVPLFALDASDEHVPARIRAISESTVALCTRTQLSPGRRLVMHHEGCRKEIEVITCREENGSTYGVDCKLLRLQNGAVRDDWRMAVSWPAHVTTSSNVKYKAQIVNISVFGLGVQLSFQPEVNSVLTVSMQSGVGLGRVKHCHQTGRNTYVAGLYLEEFHSNDRQKKNSNATEKGFTRNLLQLVRKLYAGLWQRS